MKLLKGTQKHNQNKSWEHNQNKITKNQELQFTNNKTIPEKLVHQSDQVKFEEHYNDHH